MTQLPFMTQTFRQASPGLYVHIPFCQTKCSYCDFYSVTHETLIAAYLAALDQEARLYRDQFPGFDTLYLGGGTPSLLAEKEMAAIVALIRQHFILTAEAEITLEANPDDVTPEKLRLWKELGVNRLSLGVQSLNDLELRFLGRRHTSAQAWQALCLAREAGFDNLGVDLIYALPGQTEAGWLATLEGVLALEPEHLVLLPVNYRRKYAVGENAGTGGD